MTLVLSRHRDEKIIVGDDIVLTVVEIRGDKVRLGIDAPSDIPVHRLEVYEALQREQGCKPSAKPQAREVNAELLAAAKQALAFLDKQREECEAALTIMPRPQPTYERGPIAVALANAIAKAELDAHNPQPPQDDSPAAEDYCDE